MQELVEEWNRKDETNQIFVLPNGIDGDEPRLCNGSIVLIPKKHEMILLDKPMFDNWSFSDKIEKLLLHLIRFPMESDVKINFYVTSWSHAPDTLHSLVDSKYLQWFKETIVSIPPVKALVKSLKSNPRKLPIALINILLWLLVGLREPKLQLIDKEDIKDEKMLAGFKFFGRVTKIYALKPTEEEKITQNELLRYEYGYACERMHKVYAYLYHFPTTGKELFFVDHPTFQENYLDFPAWQGSEVKDPFCTLLIMEWTPKSARPFIRPLTAEIPRVCEPTYYYFHSLAGARLSHVVIIEPIMGHYRGMRELKYLIDDGVAVSSLICLSFLLIAALCQGGGIFKLL